MVRQREDKEHCSDGRTEDNTNRKNKRENRENTFDEIARTSTHIKLIKHKEGIK